MHCLIEKWKHLNPQFKLNTSFIIMVGTTFYSALLDKSFEKEQPDTISVIYAVTTTLASIYTAIHFLNHSSLS